MEWMSKFIDSGKAGDKEFCDARPRPHFKKAYITHRAGQKMIARDKEIEAGKAEAQALYDQRVRGVARQFG